eukprot:gene58488-78022_t
MAVKPNKAAKTARRIRLPFVILKPAGQSWRQSGASILVADACLLEGRHVAMAGERRLDQGDRERAAGGLAKAHAEIKKRLLADAAQHVGVGALCGDMPGDAMIERGRIDGVEDGGGGADHITVEDHGNTLQARRHDRARDGRDLPAAEAAQNLFDVYVSALDNALRELGVNDVTMAKKMRRLGEALYGRMTAYETALR